MRKYYLFDSDMTLVNTDSIKPHMKNPEGRAFVEQNPSHCGTTLIDKYLLKLVTQMHTRTKNVAVVTNSPQSCARAVLSYHGFPPDIPIFGSLSKPAPGSLEQALNGIGVRASDALVIGDSPADILAGHNCSVAGVGVTWGDFKEEALEKAEPADMIESPVELDDIIDRFENGRLVYAPRKEPANYVLLPRKSWGDERVSITSVMDYYPTSHPNFKSSGSGDILNFKQIKNFTKEQIIARECQKYFWNGAVRKGWQIILLMNTMKNKLLSIVDKLNLHGESYAIAAPNSGPEYCYHYDVNQWAARMINRHLSAEDGSRHFFRVHPKSEAHNNGSRDLATHYRTMGLPARENVPIPPNIIIFDDLCTSGSQIRAVAKMMRELLNYSGNIYGVVMGRNAG